MAQIGHNSGGIAGDSLRQHIARIENLREEIKGLQTDVSEIYKAAKAEGWDPKVMKLLIAERAKDEAALRETNEMLDVYRSAMNGSV